jgi:hypothetical protein
VNNTARVLIPAGLFVAFSFAHMQATRTEIEKINIVVAKEELSRGDIIGENNLSSLEIHAEPDSPLLTGSLVEYRNRGQELMGRRVNRSVQRNELLTLADLLPEAGDQVSLEEGEVGVQIPLQGLEFSSVQLRIGSEIGFVVQRRRTDEFYSAMPGPLLPEVTAMDAQGDPENAAEPETADPAQLEQPTQPRGAEPLPRPELLRPFRLVAIGDEVLPVRDAGDAEKNNNARVLTIAVRPSGKPIRVNSTGEAFDEKTERLLKAALSQSDEQITNIVVLKP